MIAERLKGVFKMAGYYDYNELRTRAINGDQNAVNELGVWFDIFGKIYWNGQYYDVHDGYRLYPIYEEVYVEQYELKGWELR
jgi:hypothetical protein